MKFTKLTDSDSGLAVRDTNVLYAYLDKSHYPEAMANHWHLVALSMCHRIQSVIEAKGSNIAWRLFPEISVEGISTQDFYKSLNGINPDLKWKDLFDSEKEIYNSDGGLDLDKINKKIKEKFNKNNLLVACPDTQTRISEKDSDNIYHPNVTSAIALNTKDALGDLIPESLQAKNSLYFESGNKALNDINNTGEFLQKKSNFDGKNYSVLVLNKNIEEEIIIPFPIFLKPIDGGSGKGHKVLNENDLKEKLLHKDYEKGLIFEPWVKFQADLAFQGKIDEDSVEVENVFSQVSDDAGDFSGTLTAHEKILEQKIYSKINLWKKEIEAKVLPKIKKSGYLGRVSLDGLFYEDPFYGETFRIGDINARDMAGSLPLNSFLERREIKSFKNPVIQGGFYVCSEKSVQENREKISEIINIFTEHCDIFEFVGLGESDLKIKNMFSSMGTIIFSGSIFQLENTQKLLSKIDVKIASLDEVIAIKKSVENVLEKI